MNRALIIVVLLAAGCVSQPDLPPDIRKESHRVEVRGENVAVDFYYRPDGVARPLAVVVHGFLANKQRMAHWGVILARVGFVVAVPTNPTYANDDRNTSAIVGLVESGLAGHWPVSARTDGRAVLVGFSRGGLETIMAASVLGDRVDAWIGLDPVDLNGKGKASAAKVRVPGLALLANPQPLNGNGNAHTMLDAYAGPLKVVAVPGSGHLDGESPRRDGKFSQFERPVVRFLRAAFPRVGP